MENWDFKSSFLGHGWVNMEGILVSIETVDQSLVLAGLILTNEVVGCQRNFRESLLYSLPFETEPAHPSNIVLDCLSGRQETHLILTHLLIGIQVHDNQGPLSLVLDIHHLILMPVCILVGEGIVALEVNITS